MKIIGFLFVFLSSTAFSQGFLAKKEIAEINYGSVFDVKPKSKIKTMTIVVKYSDGSGSSNPVKFKYDTTGKVISKSSKALDKSNVFTSYEYNEAGLITRIVTKTQFSTRYDSLSYEKVSNGTIEKLYKSQVSSGVSWVYLQDNAFVKYDSVNLLFHCNIFSSLAGVYIEKIQFDNFGNEVFWSREFGANLDSVNLKTKSTYTYQDGFLVGSIYESSGDSYASIRESKYTYKYNKNGDWVKRFVNGKLSTTRVISYY